MKRQKGSVCIFPLSADFNGLDHSSRDGCVYASEVKTAVSKALVTAAGFK